MERRVQSLQRRLQDRLVALGALLAARLEERNLVDCVATQDDEKEARVLQSERRRIGYREVISTRSITQLPACLIAIARRSHDLRREGASEATTNCHSL